MHGEAERGYVGAATKKSFPEDSRRVERLKGGRKAQKSTEDNQFLFLKKYKVSRNWKRKKEKGERKFKPYVRPMGPYQATEKKRGKKNAKIQPNHISKAIDTSSGKMHKRQRMRGEKGKCNKSFRQVQTEKRTCSKKVKEEGGLERGIRGTLDGSAGVY